MRRKTRERLDALESFRLDQRVAADTMDWRLKSLEFWRTAETRRSFHDDALRLTVGALSDIDPETGDLQWFGLVHAGDVATWQSPLAYPTEEQAVNIARNHRREVVSALIREERT